MKLIKRVIFSHTFMVVVAIMAQFVFVLNMLIFFKDYSSIFYGASLMLSAAIVLWIVYSDKNPAYKIAWIIPILILPIFGGLFYLAFGGNPLSRKEKARIKQVEMDTKIHLDSNDDVIKEMKADDKDAGNQSTYIQNYALFPPYKNVFSEYYPLGEDNFARLIEVLRGAKKFIFMEYFIVQEGKMWNTILSILEEKAREGVDVRFIYDDMGCMLTLPKGYDQLLEKKGIQCAVFNPLVPILSAKFNTRDHRKITVVDGEFGFTGGINLADEYINEIDRFGHWKDMGILIKGEAVWNFTVMFLSLWDSIKGQKSDFESFKASPEVFDEIVEEGYVQPFSDTPLDNEPAGQVVYLNIINKAKDYVYITTPYLIIDSEMITALCSASKSGVDVRIVTPYHADKKYVHETTRSFYPKLLQSGVQIYEYFPGFMHGKTFVSDDKYAVVGTINLDYRSLFLHFECGLWMYKTKTVLDVKKDFMKTLEVSKAIDRDYHKDIGIFRTLLSLVLRLFAPLM